MFLGLARAAEHWTPLEVAVDDVRLLARWAEKMAVTNELTSGFPKLATTAMGQALLRGETIRSAAVWAARHPADYMLLTALVWRATPLFLKARGRTRRRAIRQRAPPAEARPPRHGGCEAVPRGLQSQRTCTWTAPAAVPRRPYIRDVAQPPELIGRIVHGG